jgi:hypothetical protein
MRNYSSSKTINTRGIDLAKSSFQIHGVDAQSHEIMRKKLNRSKLAVS